MMTQPSHQSGPVRVMAITSGKGGVGKTSISVNLGVTLSKMGHQVALLDGDTGLANIDVLLGLTPKKNLSHVINGTQTLENIIITGPEGLKIIPACSGLQKMSELTHEQQANIIRAFSSINQKIDILIVDTAAGLSSQVINFALASQEIIIVVCDEPTSIMDAYALIKLFNRDYKIQRFRIITNRVDSQEEGYALYRRLSKVASCHLDVILDFMGVVPEDKHLRKSVQRQSPVVTDYPQSRSSQAFTALAKNTLAWPLANKAGGYLEFFIERMIQHSLDHKEAFA